MNVFREAFNAWVETWKSNRQLFWVELTGTLLGVISAIIINIAAANPPMLIVLAGYFISANLLAYASYIRKSPFMCLLMSFYVITSAYGLCMLLF